MTDSADRFVRTAIDVSADGSRLAELRKSLRDRMKGSPLMDEAQFVRSLEGAYWQLWGEWVARAEP